jgi:hypothetical protein
MGRKWPLLLFALSILLLCFAPPPVLGPLHRHPFPMSQGICKPIFSSSANHFRVCFVVDGHKMAVFPFLWFITTLFLALHSIFQSPASLLLISQSFWGMFCGRWAKKQLLSVFLVYYYTLSRFHSIFHLHASLYSSANHFRVCFVVDEQKMASAACCFF